MLSERNVVFSKNVLICYGDYKVTSEKAVKHIFMSNNYSNDTDSGSVAPGSPPPLHIEKKIKF